MRYILAVHPPETEKRVALLWPSGHLERCPSVFNLAIALARRGYKVDVYAARNRFSPEAALQEPGVTLVLMPGTQQHFREPVARLTLRFLRWVRPRIAAIRYRAVIGVGIRGLMAAAELKRPGLRVGYHSLEIYPTHESRSIKQKFFKWLERRANARMDFSISQDPMRAEMLARENRIDKGSIVELPVAPLGPAEVKRSTYLHDRLGLPHETRLVLYAGTLFAAFSVTEELVAAAQSWPETFRLVAHSSTLLPEHEYDRLRRLDVASKVVFSTAPLPYAEIEKLISSAWAALALYKRSDDNMYYMGLASGKLAEYLRYGVPVAVSDFPGMADLIRSENAGVVVQAPAEVGSALQQIAKDYSGYCARAVNCFDRRLAQEKFVDNVIKAIERG